MKTLGSRLVLMMMCGIALGAAASRAAACTGIRLRAEDGTIVYARTLEFGTDLHSNLLVIPRNYGLSGTTNSGRPGLSWQSKFAAVGLNGAGVVLLADGVNEKGLAAGIFYMPSYAEYEKVAADEESKSLAPWEVVTWALTSCATVEEVREGLRNIRVGAVTFKAWNFVPPLHYVMHDAEGNSLVVEYFDGKLKLYDNPLGVMTNSPGFDWHLTNVRNYVNLSAVNVAPISLDGIKFGPLGQGSGMLGLPGDFTPPSRFVRATVLSQSALPGKTGPEAVEQSFRILDSFNIPQGTVRSAENGEAHYDQTEWTSASDTRNCSFYFHTHGNRRVRRFDLLKADLNAHDVLTLGIRDQEDIEDLGGPAAAN
jgi:choloylglycine hydrolase